jgi:hypothetical protein
MSEQTTNLATIRSNRTLLLAFAALSGAALPACTETGKGLRLAQNEEVFGVASELDVSTKIDLLWVVDNSASMDISQAKLRTGFANFAQKYMKPTWDIRVAVITTDTYLAHPRFADFLNSKIASNGYTSAYINSRLPSWNNPSHNPSLLNKMTGQFTNGVRYYDLWPATLSNYARLLPGKHDGPTTAICFEAHAYFFLGQTNCRVRDNVGANTGVQNCIAPNGSETSVTQCVNTTQNDSVRSGKAIIETMPPAGVAGDSAWIQQLTRDFMVNVTTGAGGHGSERGLQSLTQMIADNEGSATAFFRPGSLRGVVFVTDEDDQSMNIPASGSFGPWSYYLSSCVTKSVDGYSYTLSSCPDPSHLIPVSTIKSQLDGFFSSLDGAGSDPNYFVFSIVPETGSAIQELQIARQADDNLVGNAGNVAVDRGDRYIELGNLVGNGSDVMNIASSDYSPILDAIGNAIISKKSTFRLARAPTGTEQMSVKIKHANGTVTEVSSSQFVVSGLELKIIDLDLVLSFASTDKIIINYEPKTIF